MTLTTLIDIEASLARVDHQDALENASKIAEDLDRYRLVIEATEPEVIVECGTWQGGSAHWFAKFGLDVITIDVAPVAAHTGRGITWMVGDSVHPDMIAAVTAKVAGRRCMVSLDSDHTGPHVAAEIRAYGPLVTPGCHLVVEDGICRAMGWATSPLDAIEELLDGNPDWVRDEAIEAAHPVSMYPGGWWVRASAGA